MTVARRRLERPLLTFLLSLATATALGVVVYLVSGSLPFFAATPTTDPNFGERNLCLLHAVPEGRVGFAVGPQKLALAFTGSTLAICRDGALEETRAISGIVAAAIDARGAVWLARREAAGPRLWLLTKQSLIAVGELAPIALVGTAFGLVALDASGRLLSLGAEGEVLGLEELSLPAGAAPLLSASDDGERVAVAVGGGLFAFDAQRLQKRVAEAPCEVNFLWWLRGSHRALLRCGADDELALELDVDSGNREAAPKMKRTVSELHDGLYVQSCEALPCTAPAP